MVLDILKPLYKTTAPKATAKAETPIKQCLKCEKRNLKILFCYHIYLNKISIQLFRNK